MKLPRQFFTPLAIGAPVPLRELPLRLERMIHFVPPHLEKMRHKVPDLIRQVDVVLGNLEDAIPTDAKEAARRGFIEMGKAHDYGSTGLWTRINALNSPWALDDIVEIVGAIGNKLEVIMLPKVEGASDIHYLDRLLAQLEARHRIIRPILIHAILETAEGVNNVEEIAAASPRMHGISLGPADLAASRAMKTTRVGGGHPDYAVLADKPETAGSPSRRSGGAKERSAGALPAGLVALHDRENGRCLRGGGNQAILRSVWRFLRSRGMRGPVPQCFPDGLRRGMVFASNAGRDSQAYLLTRSDRKLRLPVRSSPRCRTAAEPS